MNSFFFFFFFQVAQWQISDATTFNTNSVPSRVAKSFVIQVYLEKYGLKFWFKSNAYGKSQRVIFNRLPSNTCFTQKNKLQLMILTLNFNIRLTLFNLRIFRSGRKIFPMSCCDQNKEELVNILTGFSSFVNKIFYLR